MKKNQSKGKKVKRDRIELNGIILEAHRSANFTVEVDTSDDQKMIVTCTLCGKMKENYIKVVPGDKVKVEVSPYDTSKGRIVHRVR